MIGRVATVLRISIVSVLIGLAVVDGFVSLGEFFANDLVSVPAFRPFFCEIKVEECSDAKLLLTHGDFVSVPMKEWSQYRCHLERTRLWAACGTAAKVVMRYNGPWSAGPLLEDGSWLVQSSGGIVVALLPKTLRPDHRCFVAKKLEMLSATNVTTFQGAKSINEATLCVPAIDIVGYPKCGTSAAYELLTRHPEVLGAARRKELCMVTLPEKIWSWIWELRVEAGQSKGKLLVNGCFIGSHVFNQEVLFRMYEQPNIKVFVVRNLADRLWSAWNFWCDPGHEANCDQRTRWTRIGIHQRSPELFHKHLLESADKRFVSFRNAPPPGGMSTYFLRHYLSLNDLSSFNLTVYAKEKLETNPETVWGGIVETVKQLYGRTLAPHHSLQFFSKVLVNSNDHKGVNTNTKIVETVEGTYEISGHRPMLEESRRHIMESWRECSFWASLTDWQYSCVA